MRFSIKAPILIKPWAICLWLISLGLPTSTLLAQAEVKRSVSVSLEDKVDRLEKQLATANRMRAEFQFQITNLQNEIRDMRGIIEEQSYQIEQLTNRQRDLFRDLDELKLGGTTTTSGPTQTTTDQTTNIPPPLPSDNTVNDTVVPVTPASEEEIRKEYDSIFPLVRNKQFDEAIARYLSFINNYPDSVYISNARYWLARIYSIRGNDADAEREYLIVAEQYPQSDKAADAFEKLGQLYESKGNTGRAVEMYQRILNDYPDASAARFAQQRLDNLNRN